MANIDQIQIPNGSGSTTYDIDAKTVNGKTVETNVPSNAVFTDEKAKQENVTTNSEYRVLLSGSATNSTETATTKKSSNLKFNASSSELKIGDTESSGTTYHCELSPSEVGLFRKETQQSSSSTYIGLKMWRDSSTGEYDIQNSTTWDGTNDSLKDSITELKNNLTQLGTPISASWIAQTVSADGSNLTATIVLTAGTYLINIVVPVISTGGKLIYFYDGSVVPYTYFSVNGSYVSKSFIYSCNSTKNCTIKLGQSGSYTVSIVERGQFVAIKLA